jgi:putative ABC transport system permease protein
MRFLSWTAVPVTLALGLACGCRKQPDPSGAAPPAPGPTATGRPVAPVPRAKPAIVVVRSVKPAAESSAAAKGFVTAYGLTHHDREALGTLPGIAEVVPVRLLPSDVTNLERLANARVVATVAAYADLHGLAVSAGRFLTGEDEAEKRNVCVLSSAAAEKLFPFDDPLGKAVTIRSHEFSVVGVLKERPGAAGADVYVPLATSVARFGDIFTLRKDEVGKEMKRVHERVQLHEIIIRVADGTDPAAVAGAVRELLKKSHAKADWEVTAR